MWFDMRSQNSIMVAQPRFSFVFKTKTRDRLTTVLARMPPSERARPREARGPPTAHAMGSGRAPAPLSPASESSYFTQVECKVEINFETARTCGKRWLHDDWSVRGWRVGH